MNNFRTPVSAVALAGVALLITGAGAQPASAHPHPVPLRTLAAGTGVRIGTAVDMAALADDTTYRRTTAREFNSVTVLQGGEGRPCPDGPEQCRTLRDAFNSGMW